MDIHYIRKNSDKAKENQQKRFNDPSVIDEILTVDGQWRHLQYDNEQLKSIKNKLSKCFKTAPNNEEITINNNDEYIDHMLNDKQDESYKKLTKDQLKEAAKVITDKLNENIENIKNNLLKRVNLIAELGNFLYKDAIVDNDEDNNGIICQVNNVDNDIMLKLAASMRPEKLLSHIDLVEKLKMVDTQSGIMVAGNRGYFLTGVGVLFNMALLRYAADFLVQRDYQMMQTPLFVKDELMGKIAQLSEYQETLYKTEKYDKYLIATSEQPMTAYFNNKQVLAKELPIRFGGLSTCFRKETGAQGRNTRGIYRVHQFEKVEQFCVTDPDESWEEFGNMMQVCKDFYDSLGISYRVVNIVSGALNNAASMKYDLEAWFPGSNKYCELVSCTNVLDYFSKRLGTKCDGKFVHMLNCTLCANTRTICCLLETYQTKDGFVVPSVLKPYLNMDFVEFVE